MNEIIALIFLIFAQSIFALDLESYAELSAFTVHQQAFLKAGISQKALDELENKYNYYFYNLKNKRYVSLSDFTKRNTSKRFFILDLQNGTVEKYLVSHGKGSDPTHTGILQRFSNVSGSLATPGGALITGKKYDLPGGGVMHLYGLEDVNSLTHQRAVIIHGAKYVMEAQSWAGYSHGCFVFDYAVLDHIMDLIKDGSLILSFSEKTNP